MLERYLIPGGSAGSFERRGYRFDVGASMIFGFGDGGTTNLLTRALGDVGETVANDPGPRAGSLPPAQRHGCRRAAGLRQLAGAVDRALPPGGPGHTGLLRQLPPGVQLPEQHPPQIPGGAALPGGRVCAQPSGMPWFEPVATGERRGRGPSAHPGSGAAALHRHGVLLVVCGAGGSHADDQRRHGVFGSARRRRELPEGGRWHYCAATGAWSGAARRGDSLPIAGHQDPAESRAGNGCGAGQRRAAAGAAGHFQRHALGHLRQPGG